MTDLRLFTVGGLVAAFRSGAASPVEVVAELQQRATRLEPVLNAFVTPTFEQAAAAAAEAVAALGEPLGPLHGVPIAHKDVFSTKGVRTTAGSLALGSHVPDHDAAVVARLAAAGAIMVGKANCHELACGAMQGFGVTRNPWDPARAAGGSSSGSAAAVAGRLAFAATATDTGGSARVPAAFTGTVGLKPTFGRVSRHGMLPISYTLDHPAVIAKSVADAAAVMLALAGPDPRDRATAAAAPPPVPLERDSLAGVRLGWPTALLDAGLDPEVAAAIRAAARRLCELGADCVPVELEGFGLVAATHWVIWLAEGASRLRRFLTARPARVGSVAARRLLPGLLLSADDYFVAMHVRERVREAMERLFTTVDLLLLPTTPFAAHLIDDVAAARSDVSRFNRLANLTGEPAIAVPCGFTASGLPLGLQLMAPRWQEGLLLGVAALYERATPWHERWPSDEVMLSWTEDGRADAYSRRLGAEATNPAPGAVATDGGAAAAADWVRRRAQAAGLPLSGEDIEAVAAQSRGMIEALAEMREAVEATASTSYLDFIG